MWRDGGGATAEEYSEPVAFQDFNLVAIRESVGATSVFADATSTGEAGVRRIRMEYVFVREPDGWKISTIREGGRDYAP